MMRCVRVLVVERRPDFRLIWKRELQRSGVRALEAVNVEEARAALAAGPLHAAVIGELAPSAELAIELARSLRRSDFFLPVILTAAKSSEELAVAALRAGVNDYLREPFRPEELTASLKRLGAIVPASGSAAGEKLVGRSAAVAAVREQIALVARGDSNVLITGETGTGKELVAELIHGCSRRSHCPFVSLNCAAIPESLFESELFGYEQGSYTGASTSYPGKLKLADKGTVFFDEIGELSAQGQAKLLRVIELKEAQRLGARQAVPVNVRVLAATNQDLGGPASRERFRADLYFRLNVIRIDLPPLRERPEDIPVLLAHYATQYKQSSGGAFEGFSPEVEKRLVTYPWPGNVRELRNLVEAVFVSLRRPLVEWEDLPEHFRRAFEMRAGSDEGELAKMLAALNSVHWNKSRAAQSLRWSRMTLYRKLAKHRVLTSHAPILSRAV